MKSAKTDRWKRVYKIGSTVAAVVGVGYLVLLMFPQALFAYSTEHGKFRVYSREPIGVELAGVLDKAEEKLKGSPIYDADTRRDIYLTGSHAIYAFLSHKAYNSFANSVPFISSRLGTCRYADETCGKMGQHADQNPFQKFPGLQERVLA